MGHAHGKPSLNRVALRCVICSRRGLARACRAQSLDPPHLWLDGGWKDNLCVEAKRWSGGCSILDRRMDGYAVLDGYPPTTQPRVVDRTGRTMCDANMGGGAEIVARNVPCVLDLAFGQTQSRAKFAGLAKAAGLSVQLHFIDVPAEERWRRVETRNARKGETYQLGFDVTREMFDFVEGLWEPPSHAEMLAYNGVRTAGG